MIIMQQKKILQAAAWIACLTIAAYALAQTAAFIMSRGLDTAPMNAPAVVTDSPGRSDHLPPRQNALNRSGSVAVQESDAGRGFKVEQVSDTRWVLDRASLPASNRDLNRLLMQARAVPNMKQGRIEGFRITRIARGSFYEKVGLQNGDVLLRANMRKLDNPSKLFSLYQEMKKQGHISLLLSRNGQNQTFEYDIR